MTGSSPTGTRRAPARGADEDYLDEAARLRAALLRLGRRLRSIDAGSGLTPVELSVLGAVVRAEPVRPSELACRERLNPTMLSRVLGRLVDDGVLCRRDDPSDRRVALVAVTESGRRLHQQLRAERARTLAKHLSRLPVDQQRALSEALSALEALVELVESDPR